MKNSETYREINWVTTIFYLYFGLPIILMPLFEPELTDLEIKSPIELLIYVWVFGVISFLFIKMPYDPLTELTANDKSIIINKNPFGLFASTINLKSIITIMRDSKPPDNEPNIDVRRKPKWWGVRIEMVWTWI